VTELQRKIWVSLERATKAPNVVANISHFNKVYCRLIFLAFVRVRLCMNVVHAYGRAD
jgi:hypothetical protein